jgi:signal transduction histidine kinase
MPVSDVPQDESSFKHISEEMYKQNVQLAATNKTLSFVRTLYAITMSSLDVQHVAQRIVDAVGYGFGFSAAVLSLVDSERKMLIPVAITHTPEIDKSLESLGKKLSDFAAPLSETSNLAVRAVNTKKKQVTGNLFDILMPHISQEQADVLENQTGIKTLIIYPIFFVSKELGTFVIGLDKKVDDLSETQKETLEQLLDPISIAIDRAQLHDTLKQANEKLKELDRLKDEFISIASHDLRTPIVSIRGYAWLLARQKEKLDKKSQDQLQKLYESSERLIAQVNDMLDVSRIESGRLVMMPEKFDIGHLADTVLKELEGLAESRNIKMKVQSRPDCSVFADQNKMHQVLTNIIGNAIKFTLTGGTITVSAQKKNTEVLVTIADTGIGIKKDDVGKLFSKFGRLDVSSNEVSQIPGTGLGLYISKKFIELSNGTISVESEVGKGTTFAVTLPAA